METLFKVVARQVKMRNQKKTLLTLFVVYVYGLSCFAQTEKSMLVDRNELSQFSINKICLKDLNEPGKDFEKIALLGKPIDLIFIDEFAFRIWVYKYDGITLTYTNSNGNPVLQELIIDTITSNFLVSFGEIVLNEGVKSDQILTSKPSNGKVGHLIKVKEVDILLTESEKRLGGHSFMEIILDQKNKTISKIIYRDKVI